MKKKLLIFPFLFLLISVTLNGQDDSTFRDGHLYMKLNGKYSQPLDSNPVPKNIQTQFGVKKVWRPFKGLNQRLDSTFQLIFDDNKYNPNNVISTLESLNFVQYAEKVPLHYRTGFTPNDYDPAQYNLDKVDAKKAWDLSKGSDEIVIGVVDNAVLTDHEDLLQNMWTNKGESRSGGDGDLNGYENDVHGYDVADDNGNPNPPANAPNSFGHGTHVAGIASAKTNNGDGIAGLGYDCQIMAVKCSPDTSDGNVLYNAYDGVYYAIQNNADIINMSWGGPNMTVTGSNIFETAKARNIACIASAGNSDTDEKFYPAGYRQVMAIGATDQNDKKAGYSNYGNWITVMAPGSSIKSCLAQSTSDYGKLSGTSMSAPLVSGLAGLLKSEDTGLTNQEVKNKITNGAEDISGKNPSYQGKLGAGRINAYNSLKSISARTPLKDPSGVKLYPNPASKNIRIHVKREIQSPLSLTIVNSVGQKVIQKDDFLKGSAQAKILKTQSLKSGAYFVTLKNDRVKIKQKVIITKH